MSYLYVEDHRDYLINEFEKRMKRRPLYSKRAFARDLGLSASTLVDYLKNRLAFSKGRVHQLSKIIGLTKEQSHHWNDLIQSKFSKNEILKKEALLSIQSRIRTEKNAISIDQFKYISEWQHMAFLELIDMNSDMYSDLKTSAKKLNITMNQMKKITNRLMDLKLLILHENGKFKVDPVTVVGNQCPSEAVRIFHQQILNKAQHALDVEPMNQRYNTSTFIAVTDDQISELIESFKKAPMQLLQPVLNTSHESNKKLYCLSLQFFNLLN